MAARGRVPDPLLSATVRILVSAGRKSARWGQARGGDLSSQSEVVDNPEEPLTFLSIPGSVRVTDRRFLAGSEASSADQR